MKLVLLKAIDNYPKEHRKRFVENISERI